MLKTTSRLVFATSLSLCALGSAALEVTMTAHGDGTDKPAIVGKTNLPDGIDLMVTLRREQSKYMAQDKVKVSGGAFKAGPFSNQGKALSPGVYSVSISMPLAALQPPKTWPVIGNDGAKLTGPLVKKSSIGGGGLVEYTTDLKIGDGKASKEKDKGDRAQSEKDMHEWWLRSCKSNCDLVRGTAAQRGERFDWDQCYYKCVADEPKKTK